jgi:methyl-accepting chemotaxis protein
MATPTVEDEVIKKIRENIDKAIKEGEAIVAEARKAFENVSKIAEELKKLSEQFKSPPKTSPTKK